MLAQRGAHLLLAGAVCDRLNELTVGMCKSEVRSAAPTETSSPASEAEHDECLFEEIVQRNWVEKNEGTQGGEIDRELGWADGAARKAV